VSISQLLSRSRIEGAEVWHARFPQPMNCARLRLSAETTTIFVRDGWLVIEVAGTDVLREQLDGANGDRLLTVAEVSGRTGFTAGAVRDWIKRSVLVAVRVGREYRIREGDLAKLLAGKTPEIISISKRIGRRRKDVAL
jgi:excisionase family DNA binding protein